MKKLQQKKIEKIVELIQNCDEVTARIILKEFADNIVLEIKKVIEKNYKEGYHDGVVGDKEVVG